MRQSRRPLQPDSKVFGEIRLIKYEVLPGAQTMQSVARQAERGPFLAFLSGLE
jgi:hypothetical protein